MAIIAVGAESVTRRKQHRPLTAEEESFYASFTPLIVGPKPNPYTVGDRVYICGDHPHSDKLGEIVAIEANPADLLLQRPKIRESLRVRTDDGMECFVMEPRHVKRITGN